MTAFPVLDPVRHLARLVPGTDEYRLAAVRAQRGINVINHALDTALDALRSAI
jgi:hypothetical protein